MAAGLGFEPRLTAPKTAVLPLDDPANRGKRYPIPRTSQSYFRDMLAQLYADRIKRLAEVLTQAGVDAVMLHSPVDMDFMTGFNEGAAERFMALTISNRGQVALVCPMLSVNQAARAGIDDIRPIMDGELVDSKLQALATEFGIHNKLAVDDFMPASLVLQIQRALPAMTLVPGSIYPGQLNRTKGPAEIKELDEAGRIADEALAAITGNIKAGMTENELGDMLQSEMQRRGGIPAFSIIAAGANGAEPHHHTDDTVLRTGDVVIVDFGCKVNGYHSDTTRTFAIGSASEKAQEIYKVVLQAHHAARAVLKPGVMSGDVDAAARAVIEDAGYGEFFTHRVGHGLGLKVHEEPYIVANSQIELKVGDVFSIEPGIYLPGEFGVRIENIVTIVEGGHHSFNGEPPSEIPVY